MLKKNTIALDFLVPYLEMMILCLTLQSLDYYAIALEDMDP